MSTRAELACVYSALILADDDVAVTVSDKLFLSWVCSNSSNWSINYKYIFNY